MCNGVLLNELFENIKDCVSFDSDVEALKKILVAIFKKDREQAITKWQYLLNKYDIPKLKKDIDFTPIIKDFPTTLLETLNLKDFFSVLSKTKHKELIYERVFDAFDTNSALYTLIDKLIIAKDIEREQETLNIILDNLDKCPYTTFDLNVFLKNIILFHLKQADKNIDLLLKYTDIPQDIKEKSVLKTLLIDYL